MVMVAGPTYAEMLHPARIAADVRARANAVRFADPLDPLNLYNISWRDAEGRVYYDLLPSGLTGIDVPIVVLYGRDMPSGSHKVGAAYAVLMERILSDGLRPGRHVCIWPSTGNYGIGGAWVGARMGFESVVVLPQNMSAERFQRLRGYGARIVTTPGGEANVREVYTACNDLTCQDPERVCVLNQFEAFGNYRFHHYVTGNTLVELAGELAAQGIGRGRIAAFVSAMGSGGTIGAGDRLKQEWGTRIVGVEPIQCPTLFCNGYGSHRIQGIGDNHVTWIHNVMNMDALMAIDDGECLQGLRLLTDEVGWKTLVTRYGVPEDAVRRMSTYLGISGVCNILGALKAARYYGLGREDLVVTVCTDATERYRSVLEEMARAEGPLDEPGAAARLEGVFHRQKLDWIREGTPEARRAWHGLKFFTWVEQLAKSRAELDALASQDYWQAEQAKVAEVDAQWVAYRAAIAEQE